MKRERDDAKGEGRALLVQNQNSKTFLDYSDRKRELAKSRTTMCEVNSIVEEFVNVAVKVRTPSDGVVRRFRLVEVGSEDLFGTLMSQLGVLYGSEKKGQVTYVDCDGDVIVISSTEELLEAIRLTPSLLSIQWKDEGAKSEAKQAAVSMKQQDERPTEDGAMPSGRCGGRGRGRGLGRGRGCRRRGHMLAERETRLGGEADCLERFERKRERIEEKISMLKGRDDPDGKWARKTEKLQRKLDFLEVKKEFAMKKRQERESCGQARKNLRRQECLQQRLSNIREAKMRVERKQEEVRLRVRRLEAGDGLGDGERRRARLAEVEAKLEERHGFLVARESEVAGLLEECSLADGEEGARESVGCGEGRPQPWKRRNVRWNEDGQVEDLPPLEAAHFAKE